MGHTITIRINKELASWLEELSAKSGVSQGQLIREQLEKARSARSSQPFMRLAGSVRGAAKLSKRKGFSRA
jgi:Ribbon-helix-helix protein, copG family